MSFLFASQFDAPAHFASILWWILHISKSRTSLHPPTPSLPLRAICHLSPSPLSYLSRPSAADGHSASLFKCLLPKGHPRACLLIAQISPFSVSFSASSRHSHGRAKVAPMLSLRAINLTGKTKKKKLELPLTRFVSTAIPNARARPSPSPQPFLCRWWMTLSFPISYPFVPLPFVSWNKQTRVDLSNRFLYKTSHPISRSFRRFSRRRAPYLDKNMFVSCLALSRKGTRY